MTGTAGQIEWAEQIRMRVGAEFDRVAVVLETAARTQTETDRIDTRGIIAILEEKRAEVMAIDRAGYFILEWQEMRDQVRQMIGKDPRYAVIKSRKGSTLLKENTTT
jgi:hypothetical protein